MSEVEELLREYGCISVKDAKQNGISKFKFYKYVKDNQLEKVCPGFYSSKTELVDNYMYYIKDVQTLSFLMI